ncbi:MAG: hypothetical protein J6M66_05190 [Lachnospiraceae bacterium]|nr:hypothetical protein [Lachnospiraceae bacterium]
MKQVLLKDKDFANLSIPATEEKMEQLEHSLIREGCKEPIVAWNGFILDGHKRYQICIYEGIDFEIEAADFLNKEEAISWICRQRIPEFPKSSNAYRYLVGKLYISQKTIKNEKRTSAGGHNVAFSEVLTMNFPWERVSFMLAEEIGINSTTIEKHGALALAIDQIGEAEPLLFQAILAGKISPTRQRILDMAKMDHRKLTALRRKLVPSERTKMRDMGRRKNMSDVPENHTDIAIAVGIKEMPKYDPDVELKGLCLTIPTWQAAISRAERKSDMTLVSEKTKAQLAIILEQLSAQIQKTLEAMR